MVNKEDDEGSVSVSEGSQLDSLPRTPTASGADPMLGQQATRWVLYSKICVLVVLTLTAMSAASGVYYLVQSSETDKFKTRVRFCVSIQEIGSQKKLIDTPAGIDLILTTDALFPCLPLSSSSFLHLSVVV